MVDAGLGIAVVGLVVAAVMLLVSLIPMVTAQGTLRRNARRLAIPCSMLAGLCMVSIAVAALVVH
jgi:hypothetical protein